MDKNKLDNYLNMLDQWMKYFGFEAVVLEDNLGLDRIYSRYKTDIAKFGKSSTYSFVQFVEQGVDGNWMKQFSSNLFEFAYSHKKGIPIGLGGSLIVYPLLITNSVSFDLASFLKSYTPKHYSAFEFPVVMDFVNETLYYLQSTPLWGSLYYAGFRKEVHQLYSPKVWQEISGKK
jgi:hypothetical protein